MRLRRVLEIVFSQKSILFLDLLFDSHNGVILRVRYHIVRLLLIFGKLQQVSAEDKGTGNREKIVITNDQNRLTPDDIERMIKDAEKFADDDKKLKERVESRNELESYAYSLKNQISDKDKLGAKVSYIFSLFLNGIAFDF